MEVGGITRPTFSGLATGIDTSLLIEGLIAFERRPLSLLENRRDSLAEQQSIYRDLNTKLLALRDASRAIDNRTTILTDASLDEEALRFKATSSDDELVSVISSGVATPGSYTVRVDGLAAASREITQTFAANDDTGTFQAGETLSFSFGASDPRNFDVTIGAGGASLIGLRDAINLHADNDNDVSAEVLFDGTAYRLVFSGSDTGAANDFSVSGTGATLGSAGFVDAALSQPATDASLSVMGVAVTSASNSVEDVLPGLVLELRGTHADISDFETITVEIDQEDVEAQLQSFVDSYNSAIDLIGSQFEFDETSGRSGPLGNDVLLRSLQRQIRSLAVGQHGLEGDTFRYMSDIGIELDTKGRFSIDSERLQEALATDSNAVSRLLSGDPKVVGSAGDGAASAFARALEGIVRIGDGTLAVRDQSFGDQLEGLDQQIERFENRLAEREESLLFRFGRLEAAVSVLQSQAFFLDQLR